MFSIKTSFVPTGLLPVSVALSASVLLSACAYAQPIASNESNAGFQVPAATAPLEPAGQATTDLQFENVEVAELLKIIGKIFDINIAVGGDVKGNIAFINLKGKTPVEAIDSIAEISGLQYRRKNDGTYMVAKALNQSTISDASKRSDIGPLNPSRLATITPTEADIANLPSTTFGGLDALPDFGTSQESATVKGFERAAQRPSTLLPDLVSPRRQQSTKSTHSVQVKNVKASILAYWLDPVNNPIPVDFQLSNDSSKKYGAQPIARLALSDPASDSGNSFFNGSTGSQGVGSPYTNPYVQRSSSSRVSPSQNNMEWRTNLQFQNNRGNQQGAVGGAGGRSGGTFQLPGTIERIIAVDPQNVILVAGGSEDDVRQLQEIINILDRPLRQVEIETQFVEITTSDASSLGIDFSTTSGNFNASTTGFAPSNAPGSFQIGFAKANFQAQLRALVSNNRAKVVTAPRVTAINNLTASIQSTTRTPIVLSTVSQNIGGQQAQGQQLVYIETTIGLNVTPTINGDDTVTVVLQPQLDSTTPSGNETGAPIISSNTVQTIANVRDGDTIALGGLRRKSNSRGGSRIPLLSDIPILGSLFKSRRNSNVEIDLIIFVTARIVRRAGDDDVVVGTQ